jgi:hypothetical protein
MERGGAWNELDAMDDGRDGGWTVGGSMKRCREECVSGPRSRIERCLDTYRFR